MRQLRCPTPLFLLLALLLTLHYAGGSLAAAAPSAMKHHCLFDEMMQKRSDRLPTVVVREVPRKGHDAMQAYTVATADDDDNSEWKPIRFKVFTGALNDTNKYCNETGVSRTNFINKNLMCGDADILTPEKKKIYQDIIIPRAIKLHAERLLVKPVSGKLVVPTSLPLPCSLFSIPKEHKSTGVDNADMILYAAAGPMDGGVAWAMTCATLKDNNRPSVGVMNYNPGQIVEKELAVRILAHEIAHALGFVYRAMDSKGILSVDYGVRGKYSLRIVSGNNTRMKAREHFGCDEIAGMELAATLTRPGSHWNRRHALDELMSTTVRAGRYTALTMAAFVDLGYFRANWSMAEPMSWGNNTGCDFLQTKCEGNKSFSDKYPNMFCGADDGKMLRCTSDRHYVGRCTNATFVWRGGARDKCPVVASFFGTVKGETDSVLSRCSNASVDFLPGSLVGNNSWCLDAESLVVNAATDGKEESAENNTVGGVCAEVLCKEGKVKVKYLGNDTWHDCEEDGEIQVSSANFTDGGKIKCPRYTEVCTVAADGSGLLAPIPPDLQREEKMDDNVPQTQHVKNNEAGPKHVITPEPSLVMGRGDGSVTAVVGFSSLLLLFAMAATTAATVILF